MTTPPPAKRPRVKCPRCGKRRTMADEVEEDVTLAGVPLKRTPGVFLALPQYARLLADAEALAELVALRESHVLMDSPGAEAAWERARAALANDREA